MKLEDLLKPCNTKFNSNSQSADRFGDLVINFSNLKEEIANDVCDIALLGIEEGTNSIGNEECRLSPEVIRKYLFALRGISKPLKVVDLGNVLGATIQDKYRAVEEIVSILSMKSIPIVVLGGSQDFTVPCMQGIKKMRNKINISIIDSKVDHIVNSEDYSAVNFLSNLIDNNNSVTILGLQKYLNGNSQLDFLAKNNINMVRLGDLRGDNFNSIEPFLRDSDLVSLDVSAVKAGDMPAQAGPNPNGFSAADVCQLAWYSGMSDRLSVFGLFELNPQFDFRDNGVFLGAQIIWHFFEGIANRNNDYPFRDIESYYVYHVQLDEIDLHIRFFCNTENNRWWVELPIENEKQIVSCSYKDYLMIKENHIPDRWLSLLFESH
ncbi:MAG: arginase family protein [Marinilabiliaceae bacterium]|nr:arginase family protein [Marinilabiliaceae bacterium]